MNDDKTIKITFVDPKSNNEVQIFTSSENARRAETDADFASAIFNSLRQDCDGDDCDFDSGNKSSNLNDELIECEPVVGEMENQSSTQENENDSSLCRWSSACVLLLLNTYKKHEREVSAGKLSNKQLCKKLADELQLHGFCVTGPQCGSKLRSLKRTYKSVKTHNENSPCERRTWEFLDIMEEMFGRKAWCRPVTLFSSNSFGSSPQKKKASLSNDDDVTDAISSSSCDKKPTQNDCSAGSEDRLGESPIIENGLESDVSLYRWTTPCVWLLLEKYEKYTSSVGQLPNKKLCKKLSDDLKLHGFNVSGLQVSSKIRSLKKTYKSIKDHNARIPNERRYWEFFDKMEEMFGGRAWSNPVAIFSSDSVGSNKKNTISDQTESNELNFGAKSLEKSDAILASLLKQRLRQKEVYEAEKAKRHAEKKQIAETTLSTKAKSGETLALLLQQRMKQKEEHEAQKARRHKEKMEIATKRLKMDEQLLTLLKQINSPKNF